MNHSAPDLPPGASVGRADGPQGRVAKAVTAGLGLVLVTLLAFGAPTSVQAQVAPMPANAQPKSYGEGWECQRGYRQDGAECSAIIIPQNAYATNRTYGSGWECSHGFRQADTATCVAVQVPDGGYLDPSGESWSCLRGYQKTGDYCREIVLPPNAFLSDRGYGSAWDCDRGYEINGGAYVAIAVPDNAFLNGAGYGQPWTCERGFHQNNGRCDAVVIPENAYFYDAGSGPGWRCARGFSASKDGCTKIDLPDNAHLDRSGNRWACHRNYQRSGRRCLLNE